MRQTEYLTEDELNQLMDEAERTGMSSPQYLAEDIMEKCSDGTHSAGKKLFSYSAKVVFAMAASLAFLVIAAIPQEESQLQTEQLQQERMQWIAEAEEEKRVYMEKIQSEEEKKTLFGQMNEKLESFYGIVNDRASSIIFKEGK